MIKKLASYVGEFKRDAILTPTVIALEVVMETINPLLMAAIIDNGVGKGDIKYVSIVGAIMLAAAFLSLTFGVLGGKYAASASAGFARNLRQGMYYNIQNYSFSNIDKYSTAGLITRLTTDVTNVQNAFQMIIRMFVRAPFMMISATAMSFYINAKLASIFLGAIVFLGVILYFIMTKAHPYFVEVFKKYDDLNASVQENLTGIRDVKAYGREEHETSKFYKASETLYNYFIRAERLIIINTPAMQFTIYTCILLLSWLGAKMIVSNSFTTGELMSLYTNDTDALRQMISQGIPQLLSAIITVISIFISMLYLSLPLAAVQVLIILLILQVTKFIGGKSGKYFGSQQRAIGELNGFIEEMMEGQKVVKVFCHEEEAKMTFDKMNNTLFDSANNANKYANVLMPIMGNIGYINYVIVSIFGSILAIAAFGGFTIGGLASFLQLTRSFNMTINQMAQQFKFVIMALAGAERIFKLLDESKEMDEGYVTLVNVTEDEKGEFTETKKRTGIWAWKHPHQDGTVTYTKLLGEVVFDDVDFGYNDEKIILHNVKLYANPGQKIAFVGATGSGKTTITNLINRFYDIQDGKIRYDQININKIKKDDFRNSLGIVLQDAHLFTGTVADNIRYGKLDATEEEVVAAKLANAHQFIKHLSNGYDTVITGDGGNLSQGQRQLLTIARAAIADPPVLILDEATSSIDTRTEKIVQDGMDKLMKGRTVFVIAHRLSTIKNSDVIMVLDQGRIIERGNHEDLIQQKGKYYQLYTGAFELS